MARCAGRSPGRLPRAGVGSQFGLASVGRSAGRPASQPPSLPSHGTWRRSPRLYPRRTSPAFLAAASAPVPPSDLPRSLNMSLRTISHPSRAPAARPGLGWLPRQALQQRPGSSKDGGCCSPTHPAAGQPPFSLAARRRGGGAPQTPRDHQPTGRTAAPGFSPTRLLVLLPGPCGSSPHAWGWPA